jgi:hypothetical protein
MNVARLLRAQVRASADREGLAFALGGVDLVVIEMEARLSGAPAELWRSRLYIGVAVGLSPPSMISPQPMRGASRKTRVNKKSSVSGK